MWWPQRVRATVGFRVTHYHLFITRFQSPERTDSSARLLRQSAAVHIFHKLLPFCHFTCYLNISFSASIVSVEAMEYAEWKKEV